MQSRSAPINLCSRGAKLLWLPLGLALLAAAACTGTAVVTVTATPSSDNFLAYRVGLAAVQLQTSDGKSTLKVLPAEMTVDFTQLLDLSEVLGAPSVSKGTYTSAVITLDYSAAQIIYDDGSLDGVVLTPQGANGQPAGQISVTVNLDPSDPFRIAAKQAAHLALNFNLAASNVVNVSAQTVTITPLFVASAMPIDTKAVRLRGPLGAVSSTSTFFDGGVMPFGGSVAGLGNLAIIPSTTTTYEINGTASTGSAGLSQLTGLSAGSLAVTYGTLTSSSTTSTTDTGISTTDTGISTTEPDGTVSSTVSTTTSTVTFAASQVLAGSSVQGSGFDRISGVVTARSGNTLGIEDATLIANDGSNSFIPGTTLVNLGANTLVTVFGQGTAEFSSPLQISVGSTIDAFGVASSGGSNVVLDASAGRVRLDATAATGLVAAQGVGALTLNLASLGGRAISAFDFIGSGAVPDQYQVATGDLDLTNSIAGDPVVVSGLPGAFGSAPPNFIAGTLLDTTTIQAELVIDWGAGTAAPFTTFNSSSISLDVLNSSIGLRHQIQVGSQIVNLVGLSSDPVITPSTTSSAEVFAIAHAVSATVESFDTYAAFITQLQTELNGTTLATGFTAVGQYTSLTFAFSATSVTIFLNN
jgi:hypothetical protein